MGLLASSVGSKAAGAPLLLLELTLATLLVLSRPKMFLNIRPPWLVEVVIRVNAETQSAAAELRNNLVVIMIDVRPRQTSNQKAKVTRLLPVVSA